MFYNENSNIIEVERKPYMIYSAVSLPNELLETKEFANWECMFDPLLHHHSGKAVKGVEFSARWLALDKRKPLDLWFFDLCDRRGVDNDDE